MSWQDEQYRADMGELADSVFLNAHSDRWVSQYLDLETSIEMYANTRFDRHGRLVFSCIYVPFLAVVLFAVLVLALPVELTSEVCLWRRERAYTQRANRKARPLRTGVDPHDRFLQKEWDGHTID